MRWCLGQNGDCEAGYADGMQDDGGVVKVSENANAKSVDHGVREQQRGVNPQGLTRRRCIRRVTHRCSYRDKTCTSAVGETLVQSMI